MQIMCILRHEIGFYNSPVDGVGSGREKQHAQWQQRWLTAWLFRNERRLLQVMRCEIQWLLCRDGGVRRRKEFPQSVWRQSRIVIRKFWPQFRLRTHGEVAVHPHPYLRRTWRWCGICSYVHPRPRNSTRKAAREIGLSRHTVQWC